MKKIILIVDDDVDAVTALQDRLVMVGYDTLIATDGIAALQILEHVRPDLMLLDLDMPYMNGLEVLRCLSCRHERESHTAIPVVIITAYVTAEQAAAAIRAGIVGFVAKPFAWKQLFTVLQEAMTHPSCIVPAMPAHDHR